MRAREATRRYRAKNRLLLALRTAKQNNEDTDETTERFHKIDESAARMKQFLYTEQNLFSFSANLDEMRVRMDAEGTIHVVMVDETKPLIERHGSMKRFFVGLLDGGSGTMLLREPFNRRIFDHMAANIIAMKRIKEHLLLEFPGLKSSFHSLLRICPKPLPLPPVTVTAATVNVPQLLNSLTPRIHKLNAQLHCSTCALEISLHGTELLRDRFPSPRLHSLDWQENNNNNTRQADLNRCALYDTKPFTDLLLKHLLSNQRFRDIPIPIWLSADSAPRQLYVKGAGLNSVAHLVAERLNRLDDLGNELSNAEPNTNISVEHLYVFWATGKHLLHELLSQPDRYYVLPWTCLCSKGGRCNIEQPTRPSYDSSWSSFCQTMIRFTRRLYDQLTAQRYEHLSDDLRSAVAFIASHCFTFNQQFLRGYGDGGYGPQNATWSDETARKRRREVREAFAAAMARARMIFDRNTIADMDRVNDINDDNDDDQGLEAQLMLLETLEKTLHARQIKRMNQRCVKLRAEMARRANQASTPKNVKLLHQHREELRRLTEYAQEETVLQRRLDRVHRAREAWLLAATAAPLQPPPPRPKTTKLYAKRRIRNALFRLIEIRHHGLLTAADYQADLETWNMHRVHRHLLVVYRTASIREEFHAKYVHQQMKRTVKGRKATTLQQLRGHSTHDGLVSPRIMMSLAAPERPDNYDKQPPLSTIEDFVHRYFRKSSRSILLSPLERQSFVHTDPTLYFAVLRTCRSTIIDSPCKLFHAISYMSRPSNNLYADSEATGRNDYLTLMPHRSCATKCTYSTMREKLYGGAGMPDYDAADEANDRRSMLRSLAETLIAWELKYWEHGHFYFSEPVCHHAAATAHLLHNGSFAHKIQLLQYRTLLGNLRSVKHREMVRLWILRRRLNHLHKTRTAEEDTVHDELLLRQTHDFARLMVSEESLWWRNYDNEQQPNDVLHRRRLTLNDVRDLQLRGFNFAEEPFWSERTKYRWTLNNLDARFQIVNAERRLARYCAITQRREPVTLDLLIRANVVTQKYLLHEQDHRLLLDANAVWLRDDRPLFAVVDGKHAERSKMERNERPDFFWIDSQHCLQVCWRDSEPSADRTGQPFAYFSALRHVPFALSVQTYQQTRHENTRSATPLELAVLARIMNE